MKYSAKINLVHWDSGEDTASIIVEADSEREAQDAVEEYMLSDASCDINPNGFGYDGCHIRKADGTDLLYPKAFIRASDYLEEDSESWHAKTGNEVEEACDMILWHYGTENQLVKLAEECTELADAAFKLRKAMGKGIGKPWKYKQLPNLMEEIVDVEILIRQIKMAFPDPIGKHERRRIRDMKIDRTIERIEDEE